MSFLVPFNALGHRLGWVFLFFFFVSTGWFIAGEIQISGVWRRYGVVHLWKFAFSGEKLLVLVLGMVFSMNICIQAFIY